MGFVQVGGGKREGKNSEKIFQKSSSSLSLRGEEYAQCHLKQHRIFFFFERKGNEFEIDPKMGYDTMFLC